MFLQSMRLTAASLAAGLCAIGVAAAGSFDSSTVSSGAKLSSYSAVYVAPVNVDLDLDVRRFDRTGYGDRPVDPSDAAEKADDFRRKIEHSFARYYDLADAPGPGVLTIEATLTDLESSRPTMADYGRDLQFVSGRSVYAGGAAMTVVFSEDGAVLAEVSDDFDSYLTDGRARAGVWHDADRAFRRWASNLVKFVQKN